MRRGVRDACQEHVGPCACVPEVRPRGNGKGFQRFRVPRDRVARGFLVVLLKLLERHLLDLRAMKTAVVSDTHVGARRREPPRGFWELVESAESVIHLGDFAEEDFADLLARRAALTAVHGNCDPRSVRDRFPAAATVELGGLKAALSHALPFARGAVREAARRYEADGISLCLFGHTHRCEDFEAGGVRFLNPGAAGGWPMPAGVPTAGILEIEDGIVKWRVVTLESQ